VDKSLAYLNQTKQPTRANQSQPEPTRANQSQPEPTIANRSETVGYGWLWLATVDQMKWCFVKKKTNRFAPFGPKQIFD